MKKIKLFQTKQDKRHKAYKKHKESSYKKSEYDEEYEDDEYIDEDTEYEDDEDAEYEEEEDIEYTDEDEEYEDEENIEYADEEDAEYEDEEDAEYADEDAAEYAAEDAAEYADEEDAEYVTDGDAEYEDEDEEYTDDEDAEYEEEEDIEYEDEEDAEYEDEESSTPPRRSNKDDRKRAAKNRRGKGKARTGGKRRKNSKKKKEKVAIAAFEVLKDKIDYLIHHFTAIDAVIAGTGIFVLIVAIVTVTMWNNAKVQAAQISSMAELGQQLSEIEVIGESGLMAVADAKANAVSEELLEEEPTTEETEEEEDVEIIVNMTSVEKDLKVKFVNKNTNKLISGTEFKMEQTDPNGKTKTLTDDDKDGIIYQKNMTPGTYSIKLISVDDYTFPDTASKVTVKDKIEYKKIDVADEVKTEKEVNAAKEDTQQQNVVEESKLKDTVEYVESTKTPIDGGESSGDDAYESVDKSKVTDPAKTASATSYNQSVTMRALASAPVIMESKEGTFLHLTSVSDNETDKKEPEVPKEPETPVVTPPVETPTVISVESVSVSSSSISLKVGESSTLTASIHPSNASEKGMSWSTDNGSVASVDNGKVTAHAAGTAHITVTTKDGGKTASCTVTVASATKPVTGVKLDKTTLTVNVGSTGKITASIEPSDATEKTVTWKSSNEGIAKVASDGTVTGVAAGKATITATTKDGGKTATCEVTVNKVAVGVTLDKSTIDLLIKSTNELKVTPTGFASTPAYTWKSSDEKIAKVNEKGKVTAIASGKATITVTAKLNNESASASVTVNVRSTAEDDTTTKLKDKDGNQLYVKVDGKYREAVNADYYKFDKFYRKLVTNYKYTGWQTIDNVTYFFDKNGNKVTGTQVIQGVQYTFDSNGALSTGNGSMGIDVSKWNGNINWAAVKNSGVSFAIIRCGYRGSSTGALIQDPKFYANIKGAQAAGIKVGVYFFTQAVNEVEAVEEASMVLNMISGYGLQMPVYIDTEGSGGRADGIDKGTRTAVCKAFCATIQNGGKTAGIYASKSWFEGKLSVSALNGYKIWLAQYATKPTYGGRYDMWQYTSKGAVGGINGHVDLNILY